MGAPLKAFADDIKGGHFEEALKLAYETAKLYAMKMGNEVGRLLQAGFTASAVFFEGLFSSKGPILGPVRDAFVGLGKDLAATLHAAFLEAGSSAMAWTHLVVSALKVDLPGAISAFAELQTVHHAFEQGSERSEKSVSDIAKDSWDAARATYESSQNMFDLASQQERINGLVKESAKLSKEGLAEHASGLVAPAGSVPSHAASVVPGSGAGAGDARWTSKPMPILPEADINTGIFQNTKNLPLHMQALLAASSTSISKNPALASLQSQISAASGGNTPGLQASLMEQAATLQHSLAATALGKAQQSQAISDMSYYSGGDKNASLAQATQDLASKLWKDSPSMSLSEARAEASRQLSGAIAKKQGPSGSGSGGKGADGKPQQSPQEAASSALSSILKLIQENLPKIEKNTEDFAVLA